MKNLILKSLTALGLFIFCSFPLLAQEHVAASFPFTSDEFHKLAKEGSITINLSNFSGDESQLKSLATPYSSALVLTRTDCNNGNCEILFTVTESTQVNLLARWLSVIRVTEVSFTDKTMPLNDFMIFATKAD